MLTYEEQGRLDRLYYSAARPREAIADARGWLQDCGVTETRAGIAVSVASHPAVVALVDRLYEGGWVQFLVDGFNLETGQ